MKEFGYYIWQNENRSWPIAGFGTRTDTDAFVSYLRATYPFCTFRVTNSNGEALTD